MTSTAKPKKPKKPEPTLGEVCAKIDADCRRFNVLVFLATHYRVVRLPRREADPVVV